MIGAVLVVGVYLFSRLVPRRVGTEDAATHAPPGVPSNGVVSEAVDDAQPPPAPGVPPSTEPAAVAADNEQRLLVLHVRARAGHRFAGEDILCIAEQAGCKRASRDAEGFLQYFDTQPARLDPGIEPQPLFYVANMFDPGRFDFQRIGSFSTTGLSLFAQLSGALPADQIFDRMLAHARLFAEGLQGSILDENHKEITSRKIRAMQESLRSSAG